MPYDHARKAGNQNDVWKHFTVVIVVDDSVLATYSATSTFTLALRHTTRACGEWKRGVDRRHAGKRARVVVRAPGRAPGGGKPAEVTLFGKYEDRFVKTRDGWRFKERIWTPDRFGVRPGRCILADPWGQIAFSDQLSARRAISYQRSACLL
jgi:hypothetical protein